MRRREFITLIGSVATGCPISALGAQSKLPRIGVLLLGYPDPETFLTGLRKGLSDLGYEEGRSIELVIRSADGQQAALLSLAGELIRLHVDIIVAYPTTAGAAAKQIAAETPIVVYGGDLEAAHLVAGLARPGGNLTGITGATLDLAAKNLELVTEMLPTVHRVAVLANADSPISEALLDHVQMAANARKIEIKATMVHAADQLDSDFADFDGWGAEALLVHPALPQKRIADLAIKHHLPSVSPSAVFCGAGGLASYSPDIEAMAHQSATFVDKILKGRKPSDLPVELPTRFRLSVNLKTARAIGLSIPPALLGRADEVIE
jgi:putative tryptophan/tyrosine transport system substrate-binding protein